MVSDFDLKQGAALHIHMAEFELIIHQTKAVRVKWNFAPLVKVDLKNKKKQRSSNEWSKSRCFWKEMYIDAEQFLGNWA